MCIYLYENTNTITIRLQKQTTLVEYFYFFFIISYWVGSGLTANYTESWGCFLLFSWFSWYIFSVSIFFFKDPFDMSLKLWLFTEINEQFKICSLSSRELEHPISHISFFPKLFGILLMSVLQEKICIFSSVLNSASGVWYFLFPS